eukprot:365278-Chlamydomonas_euryale.AAC.13
MKTSLAISRLSQQNPKPLFTHHLQHFQGSPTSHTSGMTGTDLDGLTAGMTGTDLDGPTSSIYTVDTATSGMLSSMPSLISATLP